MLFLFFSTLLPHLSLNLLRQIHQLLPIPLRLLRNLDKNLLFLSLTTTLTRLNHLQNLVPFLQLLHLYRFHLILKTILNTLFLLQIRYLPDILHILTIKIIRRNNHKILLVSWQLGKSIAHSARLRVALVIFPKNRWKMILSVTLHQLFSSVVPPSPLNSYGSHSLLQRIPTLHLHLQSLRRLSSHSKHSHLLKVNLLHVL